MKPLTTLALILLLSFANAIPANAAGYRINDGDSSLVLVSNLRVKTLVGTITALCESSTAPGELYPSYLIFDFFRINVPIRGDRVAFSVVLDPITNGGLIGYADIKIRLINGVIAKVKIEAEAASSGPSGTTNCTFNERLTLRLI